MLLWRVRSLTCKRGRSSCLFLKISERIHQGVAPSTLSDPMINSVTNLIGCSCLHSVVLGVRLFSSLLKKRSLNLGVRKTLGSYENKIKSCRSRTVTVGCLAFPIP